VLFSATLQGPDRLPLACIPNIQSSSSLKQGALTHMGYLLVGGCSLRPPNLAVELSC
jgi:hypothetical protein